MQAQRGERVRRLWHDFSFTDRQLRHEHALTLLATFQQFFQPSSSARNPTYSTLISTPIPPLAMPCRMATDSHHSRLSHEVGLRAYWTT